MNRTVLKLAATLLATTLLVAPIVQQGPEAFAQAPTLMRFRSSTGADTDIVRSTAKETTPAKTSGFTTSKKYPYSKVQEKIAQAQTVNKDVKGWLTVPGTNINEPITHTPKNNAYYLYRDWQGTNHPGTNWKNYVNTATYADFRTVMGDTWKATSRNTVLYGHNWTNLRNPLDIGNVAKHTMFAQLPSYTNKDFAAANPYIYYSTGKNEGIWKVFAVSYCEIDSKFFYNSPNPSKENFLKLVDEWNARTIYDFDVEVDATDRILTLSTCTRQYGDHGNQRFVVVARLLRNGESEKDPVKVTVNKDMKKPAL